ncbi:hypothetical protein [Candidatus Nitrosocosmicus sp. T]
MTKSIIHLLAKHAKDKLLLLVSFWNIVNQDQKFAVIIHLRRKILDTDYISPYNDGDRYT